MRHKSGFCDKWTDRRGTLDYYFKPPLNLPELRKSRLEGWILGVC